MLSANQGGIKYHFLSLSYDSTSDWIQVSRAIGQLSNHYANVRLYLFYFILYIILFIIQSKFESNGSFKTEIGLLMVSGELLELKHNQ